MCKQVDGHEKRPNIIEIFLDTNCHPDIDAKIREIRIGCDGLVNDLGNGNSQHSTIGRHHPCRTHGDTVNPAVLPVKDDPAFMAEHPESYSPRSMTTTWQWSLKPASVNTGALQKLSVQHPISRDKQCGHLNWYVLINPKTKRR